MAQLELIRAKAVIIKKTEEYYNAIRTNIQFSGPNLKTIVLTSVQPGEGKSTTAVNLAVSFARSGFKTLLIDADTRNSVMSGTFKANGRIKGLTAYLAGHSELLEAICDTNVENLSVMPSGQVPPNPTSLLQNANFNHLIDSVRSWYDYVIIDTPPIGLVIDAAIIAQKCDASLLVTEAGTVKRSFVLKAKEQMAQSGAQFIGVILNKVAHTRDNYNAYGAYGNYGNYGNYGKGNRISSDKSHQSELSKKLQDKQQSRQQSRPQNKPQNTLPKEIPAELTGKRVKPVTQEKPPVKLKMKK